MNRRLLVRKSKSSMLRHEVKRWKQRGGVAARTLDARKKTTRKCSGKKRRNAGSGRTEDGALGQKGKVTGKGWRKEMGTFGGVFSRVDLTREVRDKLQELSGGQHPGLRPGQLRSTSRCAAQSRCR